MADSPIQSYPDISTSSNTKTFGMNPGDEIGWVPYPDDAASEAYVDGAIDDHDDSASAHGNVESRMDTAETNITNNAAAIDGVDDAVDQRAPGVGGTTGQVWGKVSNTDYDAAWIDASSGGVTAVSSVNGKFGAVILNPDDLNDASTTNKFISEAELTKLDGIEAEAEVNTISSVNGQMGVVSLDPDDLNDAATNHKFASAAQIAAVDALGTASTQNVSAFATAAQGSLADSALQEVSVPDDIDAVGTPSSSTFLRGDGAWATPAGGGGGAVDSVNGQTGVVSLDPDDLDDAATSHKFVSAAQVTKLNGIETGAEVNDVASVNGQTGAVVLDPDDLNDAATTNKFVTAAELSKLAGIEALADVTDATNVAAAGALMDSDLLDEDDMSSDSATKPVSQQSLVAYVEDSIDDKVNLSGDTMTGNLVIDTDVPAIQLRSDTAGGIIFEDSDEDRRASLEMNVTNDELSMQVYDSTGTFLRSLWWQDTADGILWLDENTEVRTVEITGVSDDAAVPHKGYVDDEIAALKATLYCSVNHGATAGTARPTGYAGVIWYGSVQPTNATGVDIVIRTDEAVTP